MGTEAPRHLRNFAAAAAAAWLGLLLLGALIVAFALAGLVLGARELATGVAHIYGVCRSWVRPPVELLAALASAAPALAFISAAVGGAWFLRDALRARNLVRQVRGDEGEADPQVAALALRLGVSDRLHTVRDPAPFAFTAGLWRPTIFLSTGMIAVLETDELEAVLRHELAHLHRRDPLRILVGRAVRRALFFLPLVNDLWSRYVIASELAADASVVAALGPHPLARAVVRLLPGPATISAEGGSGFGAPSDARVAYLLQPGSVRLPSLGRTRLALSTAALLAVVGAVPVHSPPSFLDVLVHLGLGC